MNEFFLASNRTIETTFLDLPVTVRQIQLKELDEIGVMANPIRDALGNDIDQIDKALDEKLMECIRFTSRLSNVPHEVLTKAFLEQYDETKSLIKLCITINKSYFIETQEELRNRKKAEKEAEQSKKSDATWFDTFNFLASQGHSNESIMNMSYGAYKGYIKAAQRLHANTMITHANIVRIAQHGDKKGFSKFVDGLKT